MRIVKTDAALDILSAIGIFGGASALVVGLLLPGLQALTLPAMIVLAGCLLYGLR